MPFTLKNQNTMKKILLITLMFISTLVKAQGDLCSSATVLTINTTCTGSAANIVAANTASGQTPLPSCGANWKDIWYKFSGTGGLVTVKYTPVAGRDALMAVYTGSCGSLTEIDCADLNGNGSAEVSILENTTVGVTYFVRVMRFNSGSMNGTICAWGGNETFGNDCFTAPAVNTTNNTVYSSNISAPIGQASYDPSTTQFTCNGSIDNLTYFKFTTNASGGTITGTINDVSCWANVGIQVGLFKPTTACSSPANWGNAVFCNVIAANSTGTLSWTSLVANTTYYMIIDGNGGDICSWNIVFSGTALPIELISFTGEPVGDNNLLSWITATETNNDYFTLEKSDDAVTFIEVGRLDGAGNSTQNIYYSMFDNKVKSNITYYRLRQTDYNGDFKSSEIISITRNENGEPLKVVGIYNLVGQQVTEDYNGVKIYYFSNGTVIKKYKIKEQ